MVLAETYGWTLGKVVGEAQVGLLLKEAERALRPFVTAEGTVSFPMRAHLLSALKA